MESSDPDYDSDWPATVPNYNLSRYGPDCDDRMSIQEMISRRYVGERETLNGNKYQGKVLRGGEKFQDHLKASFFKNTHVIGEIKITLDRGDHLLLMRQLRNDA